MAEESSNLTPPYVSFSRFKSTIEQLAKSTVPSGPLDRRVLDWFSGADYPALMSGLRFLGLVDEDGKATAKFRELVLASTDLPKFKERLLNIVTEKYKPIIGTMNLQQGTIAELERAFKDADVAKGQMLTKTIRFFVKAMTEGGSELSPYITKAKLRARTKQPPPVEQEAETPEGFERMRVL